MFYRDFMQKYRPLYSPDEPAAAGAAPGGEGDGGAASAAAAAPAPDASTPAAAAAAEAAAPGADAPAAPEAKPEPAPSLIEAAAGKPKPDAAVKPEGEAAKPDPAKETGKDEPAPAEAAKPDAEKPAEKTEAEKQAEADAAKATDPDNKDATAEPQPPAPIKYEAFKTPDGIKLDDTRIGKFAEIAGPAQVSQEIAQQFLDLHVEEIQRVQQEAVKAAADAQVKSWNTYVDSITHELRNDAELGGNRLETSLSMAKAVVEEFLPGEDGAKYLSLLTHNGMGNHRLQVKLLQAIGDKLNIFEDGIVPANPQTPKMQKSPGNRGWYDKTPGGGAAP